MRADRLIAVLLMLQRKGTVTAAEVAGELEVSTRTARRDLEALAMSGVPVYSRAGRGGGWSLVGGASTDLTGLLAAESRALFLATGPNVSADPDLQSALRKLAAALPAPFRAEAEAAAAAVKVDPVAWGQTDVGSRPAFVDALSNAVVVCRQIRIDYDSFRGTKGERDLHPLGMVTKRNVWYLVAGTGETEADVAASMRSYRVDRVRGVASLSRPAIRPEGFDLDAVWDDIRSQVETMRVTVEVRARVHKSIIGPLRWVFGTNQVSKGSTPDKDDWIEVNIGALSPTVFAVQVAGWGNRVELIDAPTEVTSELERITAELAATYGAASEPPSLPRESSGDRL